MLSSPRKPASKTLIFSSAEYCFRVLRLMPLTSLSAASFDVSLFADNAPLAPFPIPPTLVHLRSLMAAMNQKSSIMKTSNLSHGCRRQTLQILLHRVPRQTGYPRHRSDAATLNQYPNTDLRYTFHQYHLLIPPRYPARMLTWQVGQFYSLLTHPSGSISHAGSHPFSDSCRARVSKLLKPIALPIRSGSAERPRNRAAQAKAF